MKGNKEKKMEEQVQFIHAFLTREPTKGEAIDGHTVEELAIGRVTIAWTEKKGRSKANVKYVAGLAWCTDRDQFGRAKGRLIAGNRLKDCPFEIKIQKFVTTKYGVKRPAIEDVLHQVCVHALTYSPEKCRTPGWALRAAKTGYYVTLPPKVASKEVSDGV